MCPALPAAPHQSLRQVVYRPRLQVGRVGAGRPCAGLGFSGRWGWVGVPSLHYRDCLDNSARGPNLRKGPKSNDATTGPTLAQMGLTLAASSPIASCAPEVESRHPRTLRAGFGDPIRRRSKPRRFIGDGFFHAQHGQGCVVHGPLQWRAVWGHPRGCAGPFVRFANPARSATLSWRRGRQVLDLSRRSHHG